MKTLLLALLLEIPLLGSDWYVSTNGSGNGSLGSPWSLQVALTNSSIHAGDNLWLRNGTYFPVSTNNGYGGDLIWSSSITGATNSLVSIRPYTNESVSIDRPWIFVPWGTKSYLRFKDLTFYDSFKGQHPTNGGSLVWSHFANGASGNGGTGNEWINCVIHDVDNCWGYETTVRGCILWNVGLNQYEHVIYPAGAVFSGNISGYHSHEVVNLTTFSIPSLTVSSNIMFGASQTTGPSLSAGGDILLGGSNYSIVNNFTYNFWPYSTISGSVQPGYGTNILIANNVIVDNQPLAFAGGTNADGISVTITNNTLVMNSTNTMYNIVDRRISDGTWLWDFNQYAARAPKNVQFRSGDASFLTFSQWTNTYGYDVSSVSLNQSFPSDIVAVIPNQDQAKRGHIVIYNFSLADNVTVDVSRVLSSGDTYQLISALNYDYGVIKSGTVNGSTISVPMTNLTAAPVLYKGGWDLTNSAVMAPEFGAFVLLGQSPPTVRATIHNATLRNSSL